MLTIAEIRDYKIIDDDNYKDTISLMEEFKILKLTRNPFYLDIDDFNKILMWKLGGMFSFGAEKRDELSTDELIKEITLTAFNIKHLNKDFEIKLKIDLLCVLRGVAERVASAMLALVYPEEYGVMDFRNWNQIYGGKRKEAYTANDYIKYLKRIREIATELNLTPQEVDYRIWQYDLRSNKSK